jgi:hypothetical protein
VSRHLRGAVATTWAGREPSLAAAPADADRGRPVIALRDEVDGGPHQGPLGDRSALERLVQLAALKALHPGPDADVHGWRVLRLQHADALDHPRKRAPHPLEEQLAGEQGPIQFGGGEDALGRAHARKLAGAHSRDDQHSRYSTAG